MIEIYKQSGKIRILVDRDGTTDKSCIPVMLALKEMGVEFGIATGGNIEDVINELGTLKPFRRVYANNAEFWYDVDGNGQYHLVRGDTNAKIEMHPAVEQGINALQKKFPHSVKEVSLRRGAGATVWYETVYRHRRRLARRVGRGYGYGKARYKNKRVKCWTS